MVRMTVPTIFVISMAVSAALMSGSGFNDEIGAGWEASQLDDTGDDLRQQAKSDVDTSVVSQALNLIGLALKSIDIMVQTFAWVYLFPVALMNVGFPPWFAVPIGLPVLYINLIGTASILRGMNIR